jgi:hypothetical protein
MGGDKSGTLSLHPKQSLSSIPFPAIITNYFVGHGKMDQPNISQEEFNETDLF